jgi:hypothetical protein
MHVKRSADSSKHVASWKWARGAATDAASFGDPGATTDYAWCLYDESGGTPTLVMSVVLPGARQCNGRACWKMGRDGGWIYKDKSHGQSGVGHLLLKPGPDGVAAIVMRAHGVNVPLPSLPLSQDPQVRVRLLNGAGECWESVYTAPAARNDADRFSDSR